MKFKTLMVLKAIVCIILGPVMLFIPGKLVALLGSALIPGAGYYASRQFGSALIGEFMLTWFGRNAEPSMTRRAIILNIFVFDVIGFVVTMQVLLAKGMNLLGWGVAAVYFFFALGFGYFLLPQKQAE
jgi:hypothetical protein